MHILQISLNFQRTEVLGTFSIFARGARRIIVDDMCRVFKIVGPCIFSFTDFFQIFANSYINGI